jgi:hypothetical protein
MLFLTLLASSAHSGQATQPLLIRSTSAAGHERLLHLVIGSPDGVRSVIHALHRLHYTEQGNWTPQLTIPDSGLTVLPQPGEVFSLLQRDRRISDQ